MTTQSSGGIVANWKVLPCFWDVKNSITFSIKRRIRILGHPFESLENVIGKRHIKGQEVKTGGTHMMFHAYQQK